ncbi:MAG: hypothetical protein KGH68_02370 [Patescibacteria group bacterium]|nr:hypothetical protein [Patescibacteria group bacterium]
MFNIADYLKKFSRFEGDSRAQREAVSKVLKEICGIDSANFDIKRGVLYVKAPAPARAIVFMKKAAVLSRLGSEFPHVRVRDIR